jgi:uncharacterized protein (DUF849 family)
MCATRKQVPRIAPCHLYREVVERIRESDTDVVINLTAGMGGDIVFGPTDAPLPLSEQGTDMVSAAERVAHLEACLPEIATLDCGTMNFAEADYVMTNTPGMLRDMASRMAISVFASRSRPLIRVIYGSPSSW